MKNFNILSGTTLDHCFEAHKWDPMDSLTITKAFFTRPVQGFIEIEIDFFGERS